MKRFITPWRLAIVALFALIYWYALTPQTVQYRLIVEIQNDQKVITESSVIKASYYHEDYGLFKGWSQIPWRSDCSGVAPIFDLGDKGWLIVPLRWDIEGFTQAQREIAYPNPPNSPLHCYTLAMKVFGHNANSVWRAQFDKPQILNQQMYPAFIWIPASNDWRLARQFLYNDFSSILSGVSIRSITLKPEYLAHRTIRVEPAPGWLKSLRAQGTTTKRPGQFTLIRYMIEDAK
jgi:hypothetical protein